MLEGIQVTSIGHFIAAPLATRYLSDLGADVIKIENVESGDIYRHVDHYEDGTSDKMTLQFAEYNRGKQSVALDLKSERGINITKKLLKKSDIFVHNLRPKAIENLGLDYTSVSEISEDIVYCSLTGFGETGPYKNKAALDGVIQAMSGYMQRNSIETEELVRCGIFIADQLNGIYAAQAILAGLIGKLKDGQGTHIDYSMLDGVVSVMNQEIAEYSATGEVADVSRHTSLPNDSFQTATGPIYLIVPEARWETFCRMMDLEELLEDARFETVADRQANTEALNEQVAESLVDASREEWLNRFEGQGIYVAPINTVEEIFTDTQIDHRNLIHDAEDDDFGSYLSLGYPANFSTYNPVPSHQVPTHGEHTAEVLANLGYSASEIATLEADDVAVSSD
jgi:crotonobetainyl-CoA:carnitine CoA-transferase CaiB-like acyl-CoA transferase